MQAVKLSESAVAVLRFRIKGYRMPVRDRDRAAYQELVEAGIMEPVPGPVTDFRFTTSSMEHRDAILERETERIERERYAPPDGDLSEAARALLRRLVSGERVEVNEATRPAYRELAAARVMIPVHTFVG